MGTRRPEGPPAERATPGDRVAMRLLWPILRAAEQAGVAAPALLARAQVPAPSEDLASCDEAVTLAQYLRLWEAALEQARAPAFPLAAATCLGPESFGVIGFACITSRTLAEAFHRAARYHVLCTANSRWRREELPGTPATCALVFEQDGSAGPGRAAAVEFGLAEMLHQARALSRQPIAPLAVCFRHARPSAGDGPYRAFFGAEVRWEQPRDQLLMSVEVLEQASPKADPWMLALFDKQAEALLARTPGEPTIRQSVEREIVAALPSGTPSLAGVARLLRTSERTLRRRLAEEGTSFQALLEGCRSTLAGRYLERRDLALAEVAFLLGFSEPSPFYRAFRRWFGQSPESYRQQLAVVS